MSNFIEKIKETLKNIFSYKGVRIKNKGDLYAKYLTKRSYALMGVKEIKTNEMHPIVVDKRNNQMCIVKVNLKKRNRVNQEEEKNNYDQVNMAFSNIETKIKTILITENTDMLRENIEFIEKRFLQETDIEIKKHLYEELVYTNQLNAYGETNEYKFIPYGDLQEVIERLQIPYNVHILDYDEAQDILFKINNF